MRIPLSPDTSTTAAVLQIIAWRAMSSTEKLQQVARTTGLVLRLEREGLRRRHPDFAPEELHLAAVARRLGPILFGSVYQSARRGR